VKRGSKRIILFVVIAAVFVFIRLSGVADYLTWEAVQENRESLSRWVTAHYSLSVITYIGLYIVTVAFSIPGATVLTLAGGFLFGTLWGVVYVNLGATTGAALAFLSSRYLLGGWVQERYGEQLKRYNDEIEKNGHLYLLTLRFIPLFPFFLINILSGLTTVPLRTFAWTTSLGIIPGSAVYAFAGSRLAVIRSPDDVLSLPIIIALVFLGLFSLSPVIIRRFMRQR
jgi:uncharacterized membrane protein YdjX (TVP38/TMEM64 family)